MQESISKVVLLRSATAATAPTTTSPAVTHKTIPLARWLFNEAQATTIKASAAPSHALRENPKKPAPAAARRQTWPRSTFLIFP